MTDKQLTLPQKKAMVVSSFRLEENGAVPIGDPSFENWLACLQFVRSAGKSVHFWLGDLLNYGELKWGETYREAVALTGFDIQTLRNDKWVSSRIPSERRHEALSFAHHMDVADLEEEEQEELLTQAQEQKLTRDQFRKFINKNQMHYEEKPSPKPDTSFTKVITDGKVFLASLRQFSDSEIPYDDYSQLTDLFTEITKVAKTITYETTDTED